MGNTISSKFYIDGEPYTFTSTRKAGESNVAFATRHCDKLVLVIQALEDANTLEVDSLGVSTEREEEENDVDFCARHRTEILEAVV